MSISVIIIYTKSIIVSYLLKLNKCEVLKYGASGASGGGSGGAINDLHNIKYNIILYIYIYSKYYLYTHHIKILND
jgi:hypothetical protein